MRKAIVRASVMTVIFVLMAGVLLYPAGKGKTAVKKQCNFMLVFEVMEYSSQLKEAVTYFFDKVFQQGDLLIINTPVKLHGFSPDKLAVPKKKLIADILKILKTDITQGYSRYRSVLEEMTRSVQELSGESSSGRGRGAKSIIQSYLQNRQNLIALRGVENYEARLMNYSKIFRRTRGENHLLMFLQKTSRPIPDRDTMEVLRQKPSQYGFKAVDAFLGESYKINIDFQKIGIAFKYANVRFHFLYLKNKTLKARRGIDYVENFGDIYSIFSKIAGVTDGIKLTTAKPSSFVKRVEMAVEGKVDVEVVDEKME